jgi:23S rRNA pseudouridine2605 synthase
LAERLQKYMARCGVASRRNCEKIIKEGRVSINGVIIKEMGVKVNPKIHEVRVDNRIIRPEPEKIYIVLNKPSGYITSLKDPQGRPTVMDLIGCIESRIYPVGRLDYESEGLLLLTNDGEMAHALTHPKYEIKKQYSVIVTGYPKESDINALRKGIDIGGYITWPAEVVCMGRRGSDSLYRVVIHEGRNRQVRRMFEAIGHPVNRLKREGLANICLGNLALGRWRYLSKKEIEDLKTLVINSRERG